MANYTSVCSLSAATTQQNTSHPPLPTHFQYERRKTAEWRVGHFHYRREENWSIPGQFIETQALDNTENTDSTSSCPSQEYKQREDCGDISTTHAESSVVEKAPAWATTLHVQTNIIKGAYEDIFTSRNITTTGSEDMQKFAQGPEEAHRSSHMALLSPVTCLEAPQVPFYINHAAMLSAYSSFIHMQEGDPQGKYQAKTPNTQTKEGMWKHE